MTVDPGEAMSHCGFFQGKITNFGDINEADIKKEKGPEFPAARQTFHVLTWRFYFLWTCYKPKSHLHNQIRGINALNKHIGGQKRSENKED